MRTILFLVALFTVLILGLSYYQESTRPPFVDRNNIYLALGYAKANLQQFSNASNRLILYPSSSLSPFVESFTLLNNNYNKLKNLSSDQFDIASLIFFDTFASLDDLLVELSANVTEIQRAYGAQGYPQTVRAYAKMFPVYVETFSQDLIQLEAAYRDQFVFNEILFDRGIFLFFMSVCVFCIVALVIFRVNQKRIFVNYKKEACEKNQEIELACQTLKDTQGQLIQSEKMSALGQMVAGVAHEINTPLSYASSNLVFIKNFMTNITELMNDIGSAYLEFNKKSKNNTAIKRKMNDVFKCYKVLSDDGVLQETIALLNDSYYGLEEIDKIIASLKTFSRLDRQAIERFNLCDSLDNTLSMLSSNMSKGNVRVEKKYSGEMFMEGNPSKINQVFLNVINNAIYSMSESGGQLTIAVENLDHTLRVNLIDTGTGMNEITRAKIFDPFYTTKPVGEGTGLGMSICYNIVKEHNGQIKVASVIGEGTTISLKFPVKLVNAVSENFA